MMMLAPGRPHSASSAAPTGAPRTPPSQKFCCPRLNSIFTTSQTVLPSPSVTLENTTGTLAMRVAISTVLAANISTLYPAASR